MSCHVMSCHVMSSHVMSCHVMSCHVLPCGLLTVQRAATARSVSDDWGSTANPRTVQWGKRTTRGPHREPENPRTGGFVPALSMHRAFSETPNACTAALICFGWGRSKRSVYAKEQYRVPASLEKLAAGFLGLTGGTRTSILIRAYGSLRMVFASKTTSRDNRKLPKCRFSIGISHPGSFLKDIL